MPEEFDEKRQVRSTALDDVEDSRDAYFYRKGKDMSSKARNLMEPVRDKEEDILAYEVDLDWEFLTDWPLPELGSLRMKEDHLRRQLDLLREDSEWVYFIGCQA